MLTAEDFLGSKGWCNQKVRMLFSKLDTDKDGYITMEDHRRPTEALLEYYKDRSSPKAVDAFRAATDKQRKLMGDYDTLNTLEFLAKIAEMAAGDLRRMLRNQELVLTTVSETLFDLLDMDGNGVVSKEDFRQGYRLLGWTDKEFDKEHMVTLNREQMEKIAKDFWFKINY